VLDVVEEGCLLEQASKAAIAGLVAGARRWPLSRHLQGGAARGLPLLAEQMQIA
jgi:hypothetical protein